MTLSPIPGFRNWLAERVTRRHSLAPLVPLLEPGASSPGPDHDEMLSALAAHYLTREWEGGQVRDSVARFHLGFDLDDTVILSIATLVLAVAGAIYEQLWHRGVLRPLLAHLTQRYRVPVRSIAPALSLRAKLLLSFGGVVLLACGMALLWGFVQYKNLAHDAAGRQSRVGLAWLRSELQTEIAAHPVAPTRHPPRTSSPASAGAKTCFAASRLAYPLRLQPFVASCSMNLSFNAVFTAYPFVIAG